MSDNPLKAYVFYQGMRCEIWAIVCENGDIFGPDTILTLVDDKGDTHSYVYMADVSLSPPAQPAEDTLQDWRQRLRDGHKKCMAVLEQMQRELADVPRTTGYTRNHRWGIRKVSEHKWEVYGRMLQLQAICVTELDAKTVLHALLERFEERQGEA